MKKDLFKTICLIIGLLAIDLLTKYIFFDLKTFDKFIRLQPAFNEGISWSIQLHLYIVMPISLLAIYMFWRMLKKKYIGRILASFLVAGTIGNLIDRALLGGVRDFINIVIFNFPIFNFADVFLNIGVIGFIIKQFKQ